MHARRFLGEGARSKLGVGGSALCVLFVCGCSWSRFDDVENNTPVVLLNKPGAMKSGFGVTVASGSIDDSQTRVIVGGAAGRAPAAVFDLGTGTDPKVDAVDVGSCSQNQNTCYLADRVAALPMANYGSGTLNQFCFALGIGETPDATTFGLIARCQDDTEYTLPVPATVEKNLIQDDVIRQNAPAPLVLVTDRDQAPALAAGAKSEKLAWFYPPTKTTPLELVAPGAADTGFGSAVAIARLDVQTDTADAAANSGVGPHAFHRIIAVGAPDAAHVWLFNGESGVPVGCFGGPAGFGTALAAGRVNTDDMEDLVIADATNVTVIDGAVLAALPLVAENVTCSFAALPPAGIVASFSCGSRGDTAGCPGGFGTALDVGDLDGDGDGEVLVGAPGLRVRGNANAGAVLVYDAEPPNPAALSDQLFLASAEGGDRLGGSIAAAHIKGRDVVVAGAPGNGRAAIFYCSALVPNGQGGGRCQ